MKTTETKTREIAAFAIAADLTKKEAALVATCKAAFSGVSHVSTDKAEKLLALLSRAPDAALVVLVRERVKMCWLPALNRLTDRGFDPSALLEA